MSIIIPYKREAISSTLIAFSAIALLLLAASPLLLSFNPILQPVQAQTTTMTFKTPKPAQGAGGSLTFDAQGTSNSTDSHSAKITGGTFTASVEGGIEGKIVGGNFNNNSGQNELFLAGELPKAPGHLYGIETSCSTSDDNSIELTSAFPMGSFLGAVECSQGGGNTASSSMTGTSAQDSDGDGIPDSSDRCAHNSHHRCFKEGDASTTTTTQQQQPSISMGGNQTR